MSTTLLGISNVLSLWTSGFLTMKTNDVGAEEDLFFFYSRWDSHKPEDTPAILFAKGNQYTLLLYVLLEYFSFFFLQRLS